MVIPEIIDLVESATTTTRPSSGEDEHEMTFIITRDGIVFLPAYPSSR
jgi:hypothetical protein